jgi:hypothetical protein
MMRRRYFMKEVLVSQLTVVETVQPSVGHGVSLGGALRVWARRLA